MLELELGSDASIAQCVSEVLGRSGRIDVLINNAGVLHLGLAEETTREAVLAVFETNFFGTVRLIHTVLPHMRSLRKGRIINVGSLASRVSEPGEAFYSASKCALAGYTEALRHEVWPLGIHVSLVEPGVFKTNVLQAALITEPGIQDYDAVRRAARGTLQNSLRKGGDPQQVARLIWKVTCSRSPRLRYGVGGGAHWVPVLKMLLPQSLFDYLLRRGYGLRPPR